MEFLFLIGYVAAGAVTAGFFAPKSVVFFLKWRQTDEYFHLVISIIFGALALSLLSVMFFYFIQPFIHSKF
jgi:hypothetical protein